MLTDAELDLITTTSSITVGAATAGNVVFTGAVDLANADTLEIVTGGTVNDTAGTTVFTDTNLAIDAAIGVGTTSPLNIAVSNFEADGGTGGVDVANTGNLTIGGVSSSLSGVSASNAAITISSTGAITANEALTSGGGGNVSLTAANGVTLSGVNGDVTTGGGTFTVNADSDANGTGTFTSDNAGSAVLASGGAISITAADLALTGTLARTSILSLLPSMANTTIGLGGGAGTFNLTDTELTKLTDGFSLITIGNATAGNVTLNTATFTDPLSLVTGGKFTGSAGVEITNTANLTTLTGKVAPALTGTGTFDVDGSVTLDATAGYEVNLNGVAAYDQLVVSGNSRVTTLGGADLAITLDTVTAVGSQQVFRIVDCTGTGSSISGPFKYSGATLNDCDTFTVGTTNFRINYNPAGAAGDVTLTEAANTPPVVDLNGATVGVNYTAAFVEDAGAVNIADTDATITDTENATLASLTLVVSANPDGADEVLTVAGVAFALNADNTATGTVGGTTFQVVYVAASRTFTITKSSGSGAIGDFQTLLRGITYNNADNTPTTTNRTIDITAGDFITKAEAADEISIPDNVVGVINTNGTNLLDGPIVFGTLSVSEGTVTGGTILTITFNANATNTRVQSVLRAISYRTTSDTPSTAARTVTFVATDKNSVSTSETSSISVTDAPESVTMILSANAGNEIDQTVITITAVASGKVTGNQTLDVRVVLGGGITAGDFVLSNTTITILIMPATSCPAPSPHPKPARCNRLSPFCCHLSTASSAPRIERTICLCLACFKTTSFRSGKHPIVPAGRCRCDGLELEFCQRGIAEPHILAAIIPENRANLVVVRRVICPSTRIHGFASHYFVPQSPRRHWATLCSPRVW